MPDNYIPLMEAAFEKIWHYSTSLFGAGNTPLTYRGSGTLVRAGDWRCLLTAAHVWEALARHHEVGLSVDGRQPAVTVLSAGLRCLHSSSRRMAEWGPDLALIEILPADAARLEAAGKTFYDLTRRRGDALAEPLQTDSGLWFLVGAPGESVTYHGRQPDGAMRAYAEVIVIASTIRNTHTHGGLDYIDLSLHDKRMPGFPDRKGPRAWGGGYRIRVETRPPGSGRPVLGSGRVRAREMWSFADGIDSSRKRTSHHGLTRARA